MSNETSPETARKLAVLIDADNTPPAIIGELLAEVAKYGTAIVKRIYGNWTTQQMAPWKDILLRYSIQPEQQFSYTTGKNATDIAMIIDAMDLLYTGRFDGFCLVSSDSDFTPLAVRIRGQGIVVYGIGEKKTPTAFVAACDKFIFTEVLTSSADETAPARKNRAAKAKPDVGPVDETVSIRKRKVTKSKSEAGRAQLSKDGTVGLLWSAVSASSDDDGWSPLARVGTYIARQKPEFDPRNYGYDKLGELVRATEMFDLKDRYPHGKTAAPSVYIRSKDGKK